MTVRAIKAAFYHCSVEAGRETYHHTMLQFLRQQNAKFYHSAPYPPPEIESPESRIEPDGRLIGSIHFTHPLLDTYNKNADVQRGFLTRYGDGVCSNSFRISSLGWRDDSEGFEANIQQLATGRVEFLKLVVREIGVEFACVDDIWGTNVTDKALNDVSCRHLYWTTYFGHRYIETHGLEFLLNTPGWKTEELEGGVLVTVTENYLDFALNDQKETLKYLRQKFKGIRVNRFKIHEAF